MVLINPDNPSGNYISKSEILKLVEWTKKYKIKLLIDESFIDFSDELDATLINQKILDTNKHLYVMKSISKSYGVPGLRLGILASGNIDVIKKMKKMSLFGTSIHSQNFICKLKKSIKPIIKKH